MIFSVQRDVSKDPLTLSQVAELLEIPRQQILKTKLPLIDEPRFYYGDVMSLREEITTKDSDPLIDEHLGSGCTQYGLEFFQANRKRLGKIRMIAIYHDSINAAVDGYFVPHKGFVSGVGTPHLVLKDFEGKEIWLDGLLCGYGGEGPRGSYSLLKECGFSDEVARVVEYAPIVKVLQDEDGNVDVITRSGIETGNDQNKGIYLTDSGVLHSKSRKPEDIDRFLPHPKEAEVHIGEGERFKTLLIRDESGREMWIEASKIIADCDIEWHPLSIKQAKDRKSVV